MLSKLNALVGSSDATKFGIPFTEVNDLLGCCKCLHNAGMPGTGREPMYSGVTGEPLDGSCFLGVVFYQRLRPGDRVPGQILSPLIAIWWWSV